MSEPTSVICNAGPLIALGKLNRLDLLAAVYSQVTIPEAVYDEVVHVGGMRGEPDARAVRQFWQRQGWPVAAVTPRLLAAIQPDAQLGRGEMAVLALAKAAANAVVLMDDALARAEARRLGLEVRGTLGILVQAHRREALSLEQVQVLIQEVSERPDIWISRGLCQEVLAHLRAVD